MLWTTRTYVWHRCRVYHWISESNIKNKFFQTTNFSSDFCSNSENDDKKVKFQFFNWKDPINFFWTRRNWFSNLSKVICSKKVEKNMRTWLFLKNMFYFNFFSSSYKKQVWQPGRLFLTLGPKLRWTMFLPENIFLLKIVALEASSKGLTNLPSVFCSESKVGTNRMPLWGEPLFPQHVPLHTTKAVFKSAESFSLKVRNLFLKNCFSKISVFSREYFSGLLDCTYDNLPRAWCQWSQEK